jgi:hypothetical protein
VVTRGTNPLLLHLRRTALLVAGAEINDGELLQQFIDGRDEAAFAALVHRHGPLFSACARRGRRFSGDVSRTGPQGGHHCAA